jgi:arylsulfatase A
MKQPNNTGRRRFLGGLAAAGATVGLGACASGSDFPARRPIADVLELDPAFKGTPPNIVLVNCDDLGWGDLGCYGSKAIRTPNADALAAAGVRFTDFHACDSVCTPSRAGMLTGRYPSRMRLDFPMLPSDASLGYRAAFQFGVMMTKAGVFDLAFGAGPPGMNEFEVTVADALRLRGYHTAMVGKWHLGDYSKDAKLSPLNHGFMSYVGVPHSNDMSPLPLYRGNEMLEANVTDIAKLTGLYTDEAIKVIDEHKDKPFFLYLAHTFPHRPIAASAKFVDTSQGGRYGDSVEEIDWNLGRLMEALKRNGLERNTLVIFTSDNGPWYDGSPGQHRGRKGQSFEGGYRVPMIASWPGRIPAGKVSDQLSSNLDFFPTLLEWAGVRAPKDRLIDGKSIAAAMTKPEAPTMPRELFFYHLGRLEAMRADRLKLIRNVNHYVWPVPVNQKWGWLGDAARGPQPMLFDLATDSDESYNLADKLPEQVKKLSARMTAWEESLQRDLFGRLAST